MHARFYNEAIFKLRLRPQTPLLIKAGRSGEEALDPTLPDMSFVRTNRPDRNGEEVYVPGASLRGVLRSHAEKLLRSVSAVAACDPTSNDEARMCKVRIRAGKTGGDKIPEDEAYRDSCHACRLFGNTVLAGRARVGDLYLDPSRAPLLERRYGVAIDRVTGAVAQGPFELEILTDAIFIGQLSVRNFTLGQLGLLAAALLDLGDGLVPMGYGKSRGLGRVALSFAELSVRTLRDPAGALLGVGALASAEDREAYALPRPDRERLPVEASASRERGFYVLRAADDATAKQWLERVAGRWVEEVGG